MLICERQSRRWANVGQLIASHGQNFTVPFVLSRFNIKLLKYSRERAWYSSFAAWSLGKDGRLTRMQDPVIMQFLTALVLCCPFRTRHWRTGDGCLTCWRACLSGCCTVPNQAPRPDLRRQPRRRMAPTMSHHPQRYHVGLSALIPLTNFEVDLEVAIHINPGSTTQKPMAQPCFDFSSDTHPGPCK